MLLDNHQPSVSRRLFSKTTVNHQQYCMLIIVVPYRMTTVSYADKCQPNPVVRYRFELTLDIGDIYSSC